MPLEKSPLFQKIAPSRVAAHELSEMADKAKRRRKQRLQRIFQRAADRLRKQLMREKCLHALKREHWEAITGSLNRQHSRPACFTNFEVGKSYIFTCRGYLRAKSAFCQACVIVTKLMEVME